VDEPGRGRGVEGYGRRPVRRQAGGQAMPFEQR
jgi:hypothetical protein